jgi:hypothetical protein
VDQSSRGIKGKENEFVFPLSIHKCGTVNKVRAGEYGVLYGTGKYRICDLRLHVRKCASRSRMPVAIRQRPVFSHRLLASHLWHFLGTLSPPTYPPSFVVDVPNSFKPNSSLCLYPTPPRLSRRRTTTVSRHSAHLTTPAEMEMSGLGVRTQCAMHSCTPTRATSLTQTRTTNSAP